MPSVAEAFALALQYQRAGRLPEAELLCRQIFQVDPLRADNHNLWGIVSYQLGRFDQGIALIRQAIALEPNDAVYNFNLGLVQRAAGYLDAAEASLRDALRLRPDFAEAHSNLGSVLLQKGKGDEAAVCYHRAIHFKPECADAHCGLGVVFADLDKHEEAVKHFEQALHFRPGYAVAHSNLANSLRTLGRRDEAVLHYRQALQIQPDFPEAHTNLGNVLVARGDLDEAVEHLRHALRSRPGYSEAHNLATALLALGKLDEALTHFQEALRVRPALGEAHRGQAMIWLLRGDFDQGWPEFEWCCAAPGSLENRFPKPLWDGSDLKGRTILLHADHGLGDAIHLIRYVPLVKERGAKVIVECPPPMSPLLAGLTPIDHLVPQGAAVPAFDIQSRLVSLPRLFRTSFATIPSAVPYLRANPELVQNWRLKLDPIEGFRVGIAWQGNPTYQHDRQRSVPLTHFASLAHLEGVKLISLQKGTGAEQLTAITGQFHVLDLGPGVDGAAGAFMDTAAIMMNLDLVITSDTAIAHLAGALGVPVWVVLALVPDWRWLLDREDCPWYPSMRLFRQTRVGDWGEVFERITRVVRSASRRG